MRVVIIPNLTQINALISTFVCCPKTGVLPLHPLAPSHPFVSPAASSTCQFLYCAMSVLQTHNSTLSLEGTLLCWNSELNQLNKRPLSTGRGEDKGRAEQLHFFFRLLWNHSLNSRLIKVWQYFLFQHSAHIICLVVKLSRSKAVSFSELHSDKHNRSPNFDRIFTVETACFF